MISVTESEWHEIYQQMDAMPQQIVQLTTDLVAAQQRIAEVGGRKRRRRS